MVTSSSELDSREKSREEVLLVSSSTLIDWNLVLKETPGFSMVNEQKVEFH